MANPRSRADRRARVLVIDDEQIIRRAVERVLRDHCSVVSSDGSDALALIQSGPEFDLILCDISMPMVDGPTLLEQIERAIPGAASRMFFTSGGLSDIRYAAFFERHADRIIEKPFGKKTLVDLLEMNLASRS